MKRTHWTQFNTIWFWTAAVILTLTMSTYSRMSAAKPLGITVDLSVTGFITHDESVYRATGTDAWSAIGPTMGVTVWEGLSVEGGYLYANAEGDAGYTPTKLNGHGGLVHVRYRIPLESWLDVYARATGALLWAEMEINPGTHRLQDSGITGGAGGTLGLEFHFPRDFFWGDEPDSTMSGFTFGGFLEAGYLWMADLKFDSLTVIPGGDGAGTNQVLEVGSLGSLNLSGTALRAGLVVHF